MNRIVAGNFMSEISTELGPNTFAASLSRFDPTGRNALHIQSVRSVFTSGAFVSRSSDSSVEAVVVLRGDAVFRCEAVVDGDDNGGEFVGETAAQEVVGRRIGAAENESATVEVHEYGKFGVIAAAPCGGGGDVETEPEVARRVDGDVGGGDAIDRFGGRRAFGVEEFYETAVNGAVGAARNVEAEAVDGDYKSGRAWEVWPLSRLTGHCHLPLISGKCV
ncbi:hypothetical protein F0562_035079 [Nyssa sinensis]|uniref:Uncharacterized protein n=1 Tax=Nyssa sinensis TaxID=561372 RepID=A0A5J5ADV2_9ASTE|nr:hypothetical protein F0562_035079 [Nyssa sinensis]